MIKITADSTCDLSPELIEKYNITLSPLHVLIDEVDFLDGVNITPKDIFQYVSVDKKNCSTAAINTYEYEQLFQQFTNDYDAVIHISLGMKFSSCFQNATLAAQNFTNVHVVDSQNLSTGSGHLVIDAAKLAEKGLTADQIVANLNALAPQVETSFVIDTMEYLKRGGRCSSIEAFGATLLKIKPSIEVIEGKMEVGKKYRGNQRSCLEKYIKDRLENRSDIDTSRLIISHSECSAEIVEHVKTVVSQYKQFDEIHVTTAGSTVSTHCGPNTLGIIFKRTLR